MSSLNAFDRIRVLMVLLRADHTQRNCPATQHNTLYVACTKLYIQCKFCDSHARTCRMPDCVMRLKRQMTGSAMTMTQVPQPHEQTWQLDVDANHTAHEQSHA